METLRLNNIAVNVAGETQNDIFQFIGALAVENGYARDQLSVIDGLQQREAESTTGMMDGFAIPHAQSKAIREPAIIILSLAKGIEWQSLDGQPITFVVSLLIPAGEAGTTHLQLLSKVARMLMKEEIKQQLKVATTSDVIFEVITDHIG